MLHLIPRPRLGALCLGLCSALAVSACGGAGADEPPPNIVLYLADTLRADVLGCYGNQVTKTPRIDAFAENAVLFERAFAPSSWTRASISSLLTSLPPAVHGAEDRFDLLSRNVSTMPEALRELGYSTACITTNRNVGALFGFNQGYGEGGFQELYTTSTDKRVTVRELTTPADDVTDAAVKWIETVREPFFILVHTIDPHSPYTPPEGYDIYGGEYAGEADGTPVYLNKSSLSLEDKLRVYSLYQGEVSYNDAAFGRLLDALDEKGLRDRTAVVFTSDHGEEFWERGIRGHGRTLYEGSLHVPLMIRHPSLAPERRGDLASLLDIYPTLFELCGLEAKGELDGRSLLEPGGRELEVLSRLRLESRDWLSLRTDRWRMTWDRSRDQRYLFDLHSEAGESKNVAGAHPKLTRDFLERMTRAESQELSRREALLGPNGVVTIEHGDLPAYVVDELEALGYLGEGDSEDEQERSQAKQDADRDRVEHD